MKGVLLQRFNAMGDRNIQDSYLAGGMKANIVQRRRPSTPDSVRQRAYQYSYTITTGSETMAVCREAYGSLHGIGARRIRRITKAVRNGETPRDNRGCHNNRPRAISEDLKAKIDEHVRQFLYEVSHYGRNRTKKRYLNQELSVRKMYTMFVEKEFPEAFKQISEKGMQPEKIECDIAYDYYLHYFKEVFNYGFSRPRVDVCGICEELKVKIRTEKNRDIRKRLELKLHKTKAGAFYAHPRQSIENVKKNLRNRRLCALTFNKTCYSHTCQ